VRVTLDDEEDARRAIAAAKRALPAFSMTTKEERSASKRCDLPRPDRGGCYLAQVSLLSAIFANFSGSSAREGA
jgi:hypothetical protein